MPYKVVYATPITNIKTFVYTKVVKYDFCENNKYALNHFCISAYWCFIFRILLVGDLS